MTKLQAPKRGQSSRRGFFGMYSVCMNYLLLKLHTYILSSGCYANTISTSQSRDKVQLDGNGVGGDENTSSCNRVAGKKRSRANLIMNHLSKRIATKMKPCENLASCTLEVKLKEYFKTVNKALSILNKCGGMDPLSKAAKVVQTVLTQARKTNEHFLMHLPQGNIHPSTRKTFDAATRLLVRVIWQSPFECITVDVTKGLMEQYAGMLQAPVTTNNRAKLDQSLAESYDSLQQCWSSRFGDVFGLMRQHVDKTNRVLSGLNSKQLGACAMELLIQYRNACDACFNEIYECASFARTNEIREELIKFGGVLNNWIERVLANQLRLQCLVSRTEFAIKIDRLSQVLPGSIPASLAA